MGSTKTCKASSPPSPLPYSPNMTLESYPPSPSEYLSTPPLTTLVVASPKNEKDDFPLAAAPVRILAAVAGLVGAPIYLYQGFPGSTVTNKLLSIMDTWDALLHVNCVHYGLLTLLVAVYFGPCCLDRCKYACEHSPDSKIGCSGDGRWSRRLSLVCRMKQSDSEAFIRKARAWFATVDGLGFLMAASVGLVVSCLGSFPLIYPSWIWFPTSMFDYRVSYIDQLAPALKGLCLDQPVHEIRLPRRSFLPSLFSPPPSAEELKTLPLCLPESSWDFLSAGALSSYNREDVKSVLKGIDFARSTSGGLAFAVLARDISRSIPAFRQNVESLKLFIPSLSVVIFENDSKDGSRDAIKKWAETADGYHVDLIECAEASDCKFGKKHRDSGGGDYAHSSAIGDMDVFRQRVADYITESPLYKDFSHMLVLDIDMAVSISPLGIMHTFGEQPENAVASSGRQPFAFGLGTLVPPYDLSAFRPWSTTDNHYALSKHESWCEVLPAGNRWRNACDATSNHLLSELFRMDRGHADIMPNFYRVESAFNGAVLYPLSDVRKSQATYDAGEDGQRCEHIGFNLALQNPMYVNRKWDFHGDPLNPGGPTGWRAKNAVGMVTSNPRLVGPMIVLQILSYLIFAHCIITLGVFLVNPLLVPLLLSGSKSIRRLISSHRLQNKKRRRIQNAGGDDATQTLFKLV